MSFSEIAAYGFLGLLAVYLAARLISAAFYKSKSHYETTKENYGPQ